MTQNETASADLVMAGGEARAKPYGWIGLPVSLLVILALGLALVAALMALAFAAAALASGWHGAVLRARSLLEAMQGDPATSEFVALALSILIYAAMAATVFAAARFRGGRAWRDLIAWRPWTLRRGSRSFWVIAGLTMVYSFAANEALARFYPASKEWVALPSGPLSVVLFFVVAAVSAPLTEEMIFRGWLYTALRARLGLGSSLVISSALFALAHWEATHLYALVVFPVGLALGLIRERAGSLKASITFHAFYNSVAFVLICFGR